MNARDGAVAVGRPHLRRLREVWRSAGWPWQDMIEVELLAAGLLERRLDGAGRETVRVTDAGVQAIAADVQAHRAARGAHEALVERVVLEMQRAGRIVWRGLRLRAPLEAPEGAGDRRWVVSAPDVFSIRSSTREDFVEPVVHEIKVRREDLLADLRHLDKGRAYLAIGSQCWYVLRAGIADVDEVPREYGVMQCDRGRLDVLRSAPRHPRRLDVAAWTVLARSDAVRADHDDGSRALAEVPMPGSAAPDAAAER
ncbi:MAG: hypothetical protein MUF03_14770 [Rubrivivax sp.]|nr:hypothetical protein [Rubrivivax sp.]